MAERSDPGWPKTGDGVIDWETVFEHPKTGFIPLVLQAPSAAALRKSTIFIIRSIYANEDSAAEVEGFVAEIEGMLPDEVPPALLPKLADAVIVILRDIKTDRVRRSQTPPTPPVAAPRRTPRSGKKARRKGWAPAQIIAALAVAVILLGGSGGAAYYYLILDHDDTMAQRSERLIAEMEGAAAGSGPENHEFGWPLTVERRAGLIGVTATGLPVAACVNAAWHFVNAGGNVVINDRMPDKVAPSVLKLFCEEHGRTAKLLWLSKDLTSPDGEGAAAQ